jgi:hypothetical protein
MANALIDLTSTLINCKTEIASLKEEINNTRPPLADITSSVNAAQAFTQQQLDQAVAAALAQKKASTTNSKPVSILPQSATRDTHIQGYNEKGYPISYCWSCGITGNLNHSSGTCNTPRDGHRKEATFKNKMGGTEKTFAQKKNQGGRWKNEWLGVTSRQARMYMGKFYVVFYGAQYVFSPTETK